MQSIDSIEAYVHRTSKGSVSDKEEIKCKDIIKGKKNDYCLWYCKGKHNLVNKQPDIDKIYLYTKDPHEAKYQFLINKKESTDIKYFNGSKVFVKYSNDMDDIYKNIKDYNLNKRCKIYIFLMIWLLIYIAIKNLV